MRTHWSSVTLPAALPAWPGTSVAQLKRRPEKGRRLNRVNYGHVLDCCGNCDCDCVGESVCVCVMSDLQLTGSPLPPPYGAVAYVAKGYPLCDANQTLCLLRRINNIQVRPQVKVN